MWPNSEEQTMLYIPSIYQKMSICQSLLQPGSKVGELVKKHIDQYTAKDLEVVPDSNMVFQDDGASDTDDSALEGIL